MKYRPFLFMAKRVYNVDDTPYYFEIDGVTYYFSTFLHMTKFKRLYISNRKDISEKLSNRYRIYIQCNVLADINLYIKVETRGFKIVDRNGVEYICPSQILLNGVRLMKLD